MDRTKIKLTEPSFYKETMALLNEKEQECLLDLIRNYIDNQVEPKEKDKVGAVRYVWPIFKQDADAQLKIILNNQQRNSPEYREWRKTVFVRDNFTCQICGAVGGTLNAHHIMPFARYPALRYEPKNGITLCEKCHRGVHKERGNK